MLEEEKTITLIKPVTLKAGDAEKVLTEVKLREPNGEELDKAEREPTIFGSTITMVSLQTGQPRSLIAKMCQRDLQECNRFFAQFSISGQQPETNG